MVAFPRRHGVVRWTLLTKLRVLQNVLEKPSRGAEGSRRVLPGSSPQSSRTLLCGILPGLVHS